MSFEVKMFFIKLAILIFFTPVGGYIFLRYAEWAEDVWKTNNRTKKWLLLCSLFLFLMLVTGFLQ